MDAGLIERARAVVGLNKLIVEEMPRGMRLVADLDDGPRTLTDLLRAISANGVEVEHVAPEEPNPFNVYASLATVAPS